MPASISLSRISWSAPEGRSLLSDLDLSFGPVRTGLVGRNGVGKSTLLRLVEGTLAPQAGKVSVVGSLGVLSQTVQVAADETVANLFGVTDALAVLQKAEEGGATMDELASADWTLEARMEEALARVGLDASAETRLAALSGGQMTRVKLAALVFKEPDFILLDEPTNNLDRRARELLYEAVRGWRGALVVVSHDRRLRSGFRGRRLELAPETLVTGRTA
jgi:ATPase subunit of ABC transporter with duplicated ATPase domains